MKRILVIDDEELIRSTIKALLQNYGYEVLEAGSGPEGLEAALQHSPDLILSDVKMPGMDGFGVLKGLRAQPSTSAIPIILMTGGAEHEDMRLGMDGGADDYLAKPFEMEALVTAVRVRLERRGAIEAHAKAQEQTLLTSLKRSEEERESMEVQLRQAQKLETVGRLAAGIAHEINTPTQYVGDNTRFFQDSFESIRQLLQSHQDLLLAAKSNALTPQLFAQAEQLSVDCDLQYLFEQIPAAINETLEGVDRITRIVRAMKEFSHPGRKEKTFANLNRAIESTLTVARNEWKYVADAQLDLDPNIPPVPCFLGELNQAILNLVINAAHAIEDVVKAKPGSKGIITIRTRRIGNWAEVQVTDNGTGIAQEVRPHIFEPFFTTKELGKGTGQGLRIVYDTVVTKHGGTVTFESEVGQGTTFTLCLPLSSCAAELPSAPVDLEILVPGPSTAAA